ncbi:uncharacterized protein [Antedon mediterranea]|uniref:uncharacterized protein n=1 Tax=Antedon mediterranea TaxID=105859 RepID=UPI003AF9FC27
MALSCDVKLSLFSVIFYLCCAPCMCDYCDQYYDSYAAANWGFSCPRLLSDGPDDVHCCGSASTGKYCCNKQEKEDWLNTNDDHGINSLVAVVIAFIVIVTIFLFFTAVAWFVMHASSKQTSSRRHAIEARVNPTTSTQIISPPPYHIAAAPIPSYTELYHDSGNGRCLNTVSGQLLEPFTTQPVLNEK